MQTPKKVLVLVNTLTSVNSFVYSNHIHFFVRAKVDFPTTEFIFLTPHRMSIDMARNFAAKQALAFECDYLMFLDDDVMVPPDTFKKLIDADKDVVAGLVIIRGFPFDVMAFKDVINIKKIMMTNPVTLKEEEIEIEDNGLTYYNDLPTQHIEHPANDETIDLCVGCKDIKFNILETLVPVAAVGFSCCLIHMDVIKAVSEPYFITLPKMTEDVYFCRKIKEELAPTPTIFLRTDIECGHLMNPEPVQWKFREEFKDFYFKTFVDIPEDPKHFERDLNYLKNCIANLK